MANDFDPYYTWLGIPPEEQPPTHYRLIGVRCFEDNPEVISNASDQRSQYVRTLQTGKRSAYSQKLLNELAVATTCLLDPKRKAEYDAKLKALQAKADEGQKPVRPGASGIGSGAHPTLPRAVAIESPSPIPLSARVAGPSQGYDPVGLPVALPNSVAATPVVQDRQQQSGELPQLPVISSEPQKRHQRASKENRLPLLLLGGVAALVLLGGVVGLGVFISSQSVEVADAKVPPIKPPAPSTISGKTGPGSTDAVVPVETEDPASAEPKETPDRSSTNADSGNKNQQQEPPGRSSEPSNALPAIAWWKDPSQTEGLAALHFGNKSYAEFPESGGEVSGEQPITLEAWVQTHVRPGTSSEIFSSFDTNPNRGWSLMVQNSEDAEGATLGLHLAQDDETTVGYPAKFENANQWHHIALVLNPQQQSRIYLDGKLLGNVPPQENYAPSQANLRIGPSKGRMDSPLYASLCGFRATKGERYKSTFSPPPPKLVMQDAQAPYFLDPRFAPSMPNRGPREIWQYGYGELEPGSEHVSNFKPFTIFAADQLRIGRQQPDSKFGWLMLDEKGGHPGKDETQAVVRRWTSPTSGRLAIFSQLKHVTKENSGDGVDAKILHNRSGQIASWHVEEKVASHSTTIHVEVGDTIDLVALPNEDSEDDRFEWITDLRVLDGNGKQLGQWNSQADFPKNSARVPQDQPTKSVLLAQVAKVALGSIPFNSAKARRMKPGALITEHSLEGSIDLKSFVPPELLSPPTKEGRIATSLQGWTFDSEKYGVAIGYLKIDKPGAFTFKTAPAAGTALLINGQRVDPPGAFGLSEGIELRPGYVSIVAIGLMGVDEPVRVEFRRSGETQYNALPEYVLFHDGLDSPELLAKALNDPSSTTTASNTNTTTLPKMNPSANRLPVPEEDAIKTARDEINATFADELKAKGKSKLPLAQRFLQLANESSDPAAKYTLFQEARRLATEAKDLGVAIQAVEGIGRRFDVDLLTAKKKLLEAWNKETLNAGQRAEMIAEVIDAGTEMVDEEMPENAAAMAAIVKNALGKTLPPETKAEAKQFLELATAHQEQAKQVSAAEEKIASSPDDPQANQVLGLHYCFTRDEWARGLPLLAKAEDQNLATAAKARMERSGFQITLAEADAWFAAISSVPADMKTAVQRVALDSYKAAARAESGLEKAKAEKRRDELQAALAAAPETKTKQRVRMRDLPESTPGMVGRLLVAGKDVGVLVMHEPPDRMDSRQLRDLLEKAKAQSGKLIMEGIIVCPINTRVQVQHSGRSGGPPQVVAIDGKQVHALGAPGSSQSYGSKNVNLLAGEHLVQWVVDFDGNTSPQLEFYDYSGNDSRNVPVYVSRQMLYAAKKRPTESEVKLDR